jgi:transcription-repair coupling factor (superfamily II helicase)
LCKQANIEKIDAGDKGAVFTFRNNNFAKPDALINMVSRNLHHYKIRPDQKLAFINQQWNNIEARLSGTFEAAKMIAGLAS